MEFADVAARVVRIVVVADVRHEHLMAAPAQFLDEISADRAQSAGHQYAFPRHRSDRLGSLGIVEHDARMAHRAFDRGAIVLDIAGDRIVAHQHGEQIGASARP